MFTCKVCGWIGETKAKVPRCLACNRRKSALWRKQNPAKKKAQKMRWLIRRIAREPGYMQRLQRESRRRNPAAQKKQKQIRAKWLRAGTVTRQELKRIWERDKGQCQYCGSKDIFPAFYPSRPVGFDHVIPRAKGGKHEALNLVVCCIRCNALKGAN